MKEYQAIPGPQTINIQKRGSVYDAARDYADYINRQAAQGWEYHSSTTLTVTQKGGCLRKDQTAEYKMVLFERDSTLGGIVTPAGGIVTPAEPRMQEQAAPAYESNFSTPTVESGEWGSPKKKSPGKVIGIILAILLLVLGLFLCYRIFFLGMPIRDIFLFGRNEEKTGLTLSDSMTDLSCDIFHFQVPYHWAYAGVQREYVGQDYIMDLTFHDENHVKYTLFRIGILPLDYEPEENCKVIGEIDLDMRGINYYNRTYTKPGVYQLFVREYPVPDFGNDHNASVYRQMYNEVSAVIQSVTSGYGQITFTDEKSSGDSSSAISGFVGRYVTVPAGTTLFDCPPGGGAAQTAFLSPNMDEKGLILEESDEWIKVKLLNFEEHSYIEGWCPQYMVPLDSGRIAVSTDTPLDFETASDLLELYSELPYHLYGRMNRLNFDDYYAITWDDGSVAAYAYAVDGVSCREDYLKDYATICTGEMLDGIDYDNGGETVIRDGKYYFTHVYAGGFYIPYPLELQQISDTEYLLITLPGYPVDEDDTTKAYYKIIVEDGLYKISECTFHS